jgi:UDP-apiose/xylose synthase
MISNPNAAQNQIFNVGSADNEVSIAQLALLMREIFADVTGDVSVKQHPIEHVSGLEFYGEGYEDCDRRVPDMTKANQLLGWSPTKSLQQTLTETITYYYQKYGCKQLSVAAE